jgi:Xaa-Pro aminopeptidase
LTRVCALASIPAWLRRAHEAVLEAQRAAIARLGPGVRARDVDAAARRVLGKRGLARHFGHGVGHGLGLAVHEGPRLGARSKDVLRPGMVVTIEPGVYFPGRGGVRIEDDVLVTEGGAEVLSRLPRELK